MLPRNFTDTCGFLRCGRIFFLGGGHGVKVLKRLVVIAVVTLKLYPVIVKGGYPACFFQNVINAVLFQTQQGELCRGKGGVVLEHAAGQQVINIR